MSELSESEKRARDLLAEKQFRENEYVQELLRDKEYDARCGNFFERSSRQKDFERFEYQTNFKQLSFLITTKNLDPKLYGDSTKQHAQEYFRQLREAACKSITKKFTRKSMYALSRHAKQFCFTCAVLELKKRSNQSMGTIDGQDTFLHGHREIQEEEFYDAACADVFTSIEDSELHEIITETKPESKSFK